MKESEIESKLVEEVRKLGGVAFKWVSPGNTGVPDRIIILPKGIIWFVELKTDSGQLRPTQKRQIARLNALGVQTYVLKGESGLTAFLDMIGGSE